MQQTCPVSYCCTASNINLRIANREACGEKSRELLQKVAKATFFKTSGAGTSWDYAANLRFTSETWK